MAGNNGSQWRRAVAAWFSRTTNACVCVELSIGRSAAEILASWDCEAGQSTELLEEVCSYVGDLQAAQSVPTTYTLRARRKNGDPIVSVQVHVPLQRETDGETPADKNSGEARIIATLVKHVEQTHTLIVKLSVDQAQHTAALLNTQREALTALGTENVTLRTQLREAQTIAGEAIDELAKRDRELAEMGGSEQKWARVAKLVLRELDKKTGGKATSSLSGGAGAVISAVASELAARQSTSNGAEQPAATTDQLPEGKPS